MEGGYDDLIVKRVPRELWSHGPVRGMLLLLGYHYLRNKDIVSSCIPGILVLHNASLEIKYQGVYFRLSRRSDCIFIRGWEGREIKSLPRCLFSSLNIYREEVRLCFLSVTIACQGWEKKQTGGVMTRGLWLVNAGHVTSILASDWLWQEVGDHLR